MSRQLFHIKTSGMFLKDVEDWDKEIRSLTTEPTPEERKSEYMKYYLRAKTMPTMENIIACERDNAIPVEDAFMPQDFVKVMDSPRIDTLRSGYCVLDNGVGFSCGRVVMNNVSEEKFRFFNENFNPENDLFYKIWCPGAHMKHYEDGVIEDVGAGMEMINFLSAYSIQELSGDPGYQVKDPLFVSFYGGGGISWPLHARPEFGEYAMQCFWYRDLPDGSGVEVFVVFWLGMRWLDGKPTITLKEGERMTIDRARHQLTHSILELSQEASLVNMFWNDRHA